MNTQELSVDTIQFLNYMSVKYNNLYINILEEINNISLNKKNIYIDNTIISSIQILIDNYDEDIHTIKTYIYNILNSMIIAFYDYLKIKHQHTMDKKYTDLLKSDNFTRIHLNLKIKEDYLLIFQDKLKKIKTFLCGKKKIIIMNTKMI
jgi:hypothetical protein